MLKKQTVWLLTMLSLMIVLSVYYLSSPSSEELAFISPLENEQTAATEGDLDAKGNADALEEGETVISQSSTDELFTSLRMQIEEQRSIRKDQLGDVVASSTASAAEINQAYDEMRKIEEVSTKESILEEIILTENEYEDVLVRSEENEVVVTVKTDELTRTEANNIIQLARDEFGEVSIEVKFQPVS